MSTIMKCPKCGKDSAVYGRADVRWNAEEDQWDVGDIEGDYDCYNCDHSGPASEFWRDDEEAGE